MRSLFRAGSFLYTVQRAVFFLSFLFCTAAHAQTNIEVYGQNRVQYRKYEWQFFDTEHFRIYHYDRAGRSLARYVAEQAEADIKTVELKLGGQFPRRFNIVLYNSYDEYRQTNVGRKWDSQLQDVPTGTLTLVGDKLVVYHTGVHTDLRRQLRSGMSRVVLERMVFGESVREILKNAVLLSLPRWTSDGFIAYLVDGWDAAADNRWKTLLEAKPRAGFYELAEREPEIAGKAFWKWVAQTRGETEVKNLLYAIQLRSSLNQGIKTSLGMRVHRAYDSCVRFYRAVYAQDSALLPPPPAEASVLNIPVPFDGGTVRTVRVGPRGADVAYVHWKEGEFRVYIQKTSGAEQRSMVLHGGRHDHNEASPDPNYPLLAWSNSGYKLAILYRKGVQMRLRIYNSTRARIENYYIPPGRFDRVLGMSFSEDDDRLIFSAVKKSQTDLYEFRIKGKRMTNITNDPWDDIEPWYVSGGYRRGILFLSNRPVAALNVPASVNELPTGPMNVFFYDTRTGSTELIRCSDVKKGTMSQPVQYGPDNFAYLWDSSGVQTRYVVVFGRDSANRDSAYAVGHTQFDRSIIAHQYNPASNSISTVVQRGAEYLVYFDSLTVPGVNAEAIVPRKTTLSQTGEELRAALGQAVGSATEAGIRPPVKVLKPGEAIYQSEFEEAQSASDSETRNSDSELVGVGGTADSAAGRRADSLLSAGAGPEVALRQFGIRNSESGILNPTIKDSTYLKLKAQRYRLSFKPDFFSARLDNTVLFNRYQSARFGGGAYVNAPLGGMVSISLNDALEDHRFTGGVRLPVNFSGMTYFLQYENFKRRIDWGLLFLRTTTTQPYLVTYTDPAGRPVFQQEQIGKTVAHLLQGSAHYPLDRVRRLSAHLGIRQDVLNFKARDTVSLSFAPRESTYWALSRVEYVFDNSITPALNIRRGFRYKFFAEYLQGFKDSSGGMYNLGLDFRYYHTIFRNSIFAVRIAGAHSAGKQRLLYLMGGVDNWIAPRTATFVPTGSGENYAFQTLATNLRGYEQSARTGGTYAVFNGEVRVPVLHTILRRPVRSSILRNLQAVGFVDAGSAWDGLLPSADAQTRQYLLYNPPNPVIVQLNVPVNYGLALGYGGGLRTTLFGYFVRADAAWNIEGRRKPILYFSLGTDF